MGSNNHLRLAAVPLALGETIELQDDADIVGQQRDLDPAAQTAQAQRLLARAARARWRCSRAARRLPPARIDGVAVSPSIEW